MKRITLLVEMRCNNYCVYCGSRAIDKVMIEKRLQLGLTVPSRRPNVEYYARKALRTVRRSLGVPTPPLPMIKGWPFEAFTLESAVGVLQKARADGAEAVNLQGGEPSIWPPVVDLIAEARRLGFREILMVTNGRRFADPDFARRMVAAGLTHLVLSLLGYDAASHDGITLVPGSFDSLIQGIRNCVAAREPGLPLSLTCNVITSAETYGMLPLQTSMLADLGVDAMNLHLVRFEGFGDDPGLRKRLSFPITRIREPLRVAIKEARRRKFPIVAEDVPLCLHPWISREALRGMLDRHTSEHRHYESPLSDFIRHGARPHVLPQACRQCLLMTPCGYTPAEYLPKEGDEALRPVTAEALASSLAEDESVERTEEIAGAIAMMHEADLLREDQAAKLFGEVRAAWGRIIEAAMERTDIPLHERRLRLIALSDQMQRFAEVGGLFDSNSEAARSLGDRIDSGYRRLIESAMASGEEVEAIHALHELLGIYPLRGLRAQGKLQAARKPITEVARSVGVVHLAKDATERDLVFGAGFRLIVRGGADEAGAVTVSSFGWAPPSGAEQAEPCELLFLVHVVGSLHGSRRLRCNDGCLEVDRGTGWEVQFRGKGDHAPRWEACRR